MIDSLKPKTYSNLFLLFILAESLLLLVMLKSTTLSFVLGILILSMVFFFVYPEAGFAMALSGNILVMIFFDAVKSPFPAPHLVVYLAMILAAMSIYILKYGLDSNIIAGTPIKLAAFLWLLMILGLVYSSNSAFGTHKILFYLFYNLLLITLPLIFYRDVEKLANILKITFLAGVVLALFSSVMASNIPDYIRFSPSESVNPIWLARSLGVSLLCGVFWFAISRYSFTRILLFLILPFFLYPMFRTWSRAPLVGLLMSGFLFYLLQPHQPLTRKIKISIPVALLSFVVMINTATQLASRLRTPVIEEMSTAFRLLAWLKGWEFFVSSPLTGIGTGSYYMNMLYGDFIYPHNLFLEVACESGVPGLVLIVMLVVVVFRMGWKNIQNYKRANTPLLQLSITVMVIYLFSLWNSMFSGAIYSNEIVWLSAGFIYVLYSSYDNGMPST